MEKTFWLWLLPWVFLSACSPSTRFTSDRSAHQSTSSQTRLLRAAENWLGVPYRWGGNDHRGIDCSGLAVQLYREAFGFKLPRNSARQRQLGYAVQPPYLKPGDLLFFRFKSDQGIEHIGIYLGNGQFIHASRTQGVVLQRLENPYYQKHLIVIRRIIH